jgi:hypothetical protein
MSPAASTIHLDAAALNALLAQFVDREGQLTVHFRDGRFFCDLGDRAPAVTVESVVIGPEGLDLTLRLGGGEAE